MSYQNIFRQAYHLTIKNPLLWLFGLILLGGFNLSLINFAALFNDSSFNWWIVFISYWETWPAVEVLYVILGLAASFLILNLVKVLFIVTAHGLIHQTNTKQCRLCVHVEAKTVPTILWWGRVLIASFITVVLSAGIGAMVNLILNQVGTLGPSAMIVNFLFLVVVICGIGIWNTFVAYFVVMHDMSFIAAANAAFGMMAVKYKAVIEFVLLLSLIYTVAVFIGQAFIDGWHHGWYRGMLYGLRIVFLLAFIVWTALNNVFFNLSFLIFFDKTVRSAPAAEVEPLAEIP